jgi:cell division transport system ATP-binding protein
MTSDILLELKEASIFQKDNLVLSGVNMEVNKGEFVYLIGKVGSGKTSLIRTFSAEIPLKQGFGMVVGFDLNKLKSKHIPLLRRKIGIVFQDFKLLSDRNVHANLEFVLKATGWKNKKEINNRIEEVLTQIDLSYKGYKMPHQLSGGEQQRVVIARALLNDPELILADEPTGNLDPETSENILNLLLMIKESGRSVIMATHNYNLLKKFPSRTLKCEDGKLVEARTSEIDFANLE